MNYRRLFSVLVFIALLFVVVTPGYAGVKGLSFAFQKPVLEPDLDKFVMEMSTTGGSPGDTWTHWVDIAYVIGQTDYTQTEPLTSPDGQSVQYWFRIKAMDESGNSSTWCYGDDEGNPCTITIDFEAPGTLFTLTVTVTVE